MWPDLLPHPLFRENKQRAQITRGPSAGTNQSFCLTPQAALTIWIIILRFMGDLPEPVVYGRSSLTGSSVMLQLHDKLGKDSVTQGPQHTRSTQVCGKGSREVSTGEGHRKLVEAPSTEPSARDLNCIWEFMSPEWHQDCQGFVITNGDGLLNSECWLRLQTNSN